MGGTTPERIKRKVIAYWLSGLTRDEIAKKSGISEGNVSSIIQQAKENIPDIDFLRELAVGLKKCGFNLNTFASAYRHQAFLQTRGLNDDQIDDMIQHIDEHCFKRGIEMKAFVEQLDKASLYSEKYACPINELDELITEKETKISHFNYELQNKTKEIKNIESSRQNALAKADLTEQDISDFRKNEPLVERIREFKDRMALARQTIVALDFTSWQQEKSGATLPVGSLPDGMTFKDVVRACFLIAKNPSHFRNLIKNVNEQEPTLRHKVGKILNPPSRTRDDVLETFEPSF